MSFKNENMETFDEKVRIHCIPMLHATNSVQKAEVVEVQQVKGSAAFHEALKLEPVRKFDPRTIALCGCLLLGFFCQTVNGFDGSLFGGLTGKNSTRNLKSKQH